MKGCSSKGWFIGNSHMHYWEHSPFTHCVFTLSASDSSIVMQSQIWNRKFNLTWGTVWIQLSLSVFSSKCKHACLLTPVDPGAESCFLDWAVALPVNQLSSPTVSGSFDWTDGLMHVELSWREAAGKLCVVFPWSGSVWLGSVWSVPACCDHISGAHRPSWGNEQIQLTQQHLVLVMITKHTHMHTHYSVPIT